MEKKKSEDVVKMISIGLNAVPVVGGVMAGVAGEVIARRQNKRLEEFIINLADDIKEIEDRLNMDFFKSEEIYDVIEDTFSRVSDTRQKEKIDAYRSIFMSAITSHPKIDEILELNELIYSWQPRHIILLKVLYNPILADEKLGNPVGRGGGFSTSLLTILQKLLPDWTEDQIERTWNDLYDKRIHNTPGLKTMITDSGIYQLENRLTSYGHNVAVYLNYHKF